MFDDAGEVVWAMWRRLVGREGRFKGEEERCRSGEVHA
jgi:hypothetical protein